MAVLDYIAADILKVNFIINMILKKSPKTKFPIIEIKISKKMVILRKLLKIKSNSDFLELQGATP